MKIWNILLLDTGLSKVFIVEEICGYRILVMPYLFPLTGKVKNVPVVKGIADYEEKYEPQIKRQLELMWSKGWMHGDLKLRHVGLWKKSGGELVVQLFDFGNAEECGEGDMDVYIQGELQKLKDEYKEGCE